MATAEEVKKYQEYKSMVMEQVRLLGKSTTLLYAFMPGVDKMILTELKTALEKGYLEGMQR